jgi:hypothetical protein
LFLCHRSSTPRCALTRNGRTELVVSPLRATSLAHRVPTTWLGDNIMHISTPQHEDASVSVLTIMFERHLNSAFCAARWVPPQCKSGCPSSAQRLHSKAVSALIALAPGATARHRTLDGLDPSQSSVNDTCIPERVLATVALLAEQSGNTSLHTASIYTALGPRIQPRFTAW